ncbi:DUF2076 domain-containing protein [Mangrovibacter yixingensis]|uniref:DUF2076 domain-containing protein n=1 Tax=Mangrovibacter yixingensis TaxID=1529639 RepID=UPI001CFA36D1|nr:DUF2076 domain-containing protein [Mangrovibacter yixingensis]
MQPEEKNLIDGLFQRLETTDHSGSPRDEQAMQLIQQHLARQPEAPYYMAQTLLIQDAAIRKLHSQIQQLQNQVSELQTQATHSKSGGFLSGLFGGGHTTTPQPQSQPVSPVTQAPAGYSPQQPPTSPPAYTGRSGGSFMTGALQTAAGVAGGMVLGNMLTGLFHSSRPEEIVNIINEPAPDQNGFMPGALDNTTSFQPDASQDFSDTTDRFYGGSGLGDDNAFMGNDNSFMDNNSDFGNSFDDGFNSDDDSWI